MRQERAARYWPLLVALMLTVILAGGTACLIRVRTDMAGLLPTATSAASQIMLRQIQSGSAGRILLVGLDGVPQDRLAALSGRMRRELRGTAAFNLVENGEDLIDPAAMAELFRYRYMLTPHISADQFSASSLRIDFQKLLGALGSSASPLVQLYAMPDPTGAFTALLEDVQGPSRIRSLGGVWFAADRPRALMLLQMHAGGLDYVAADTALAALQGAFRAAREAVPGSGAARMVVSGPAVFTRDTAHAVQSDVRLLSTLSTACMVLLLYWRFRSIWVLAVVAVPLLASIAAGALAVQLCFGFVHGITLGYGITMLGVSIDYPVLLIGHRKFAEAPEDTLRRIGATFNLAVLTALMGLTGMVFARLPGLSQLGVFAAAGLVTAAAVTRGVLPRLVAAPDLAPVSLGNPARLMRAEGLRRWRLPALGGVALAAAALLVAAGGPAWDNDHGHLSPLGASELALDAQLRGELGAGEAGTFLVVQAASAEDVLAREEALRPKLQALAANGTLEGVDMAADLLPSVAVQRARQAMLPDAAALSADIAHAAEGLGFSPAAFNRFRDDVAAARGMAPLAPGTLPPALAASRLLTARLGTLLFSSETGGKTGWCGIIVPRGLRDPAALAAAFKNEANISYMDIHAETNEIAEGYVRQAWPALLAGAAGAIVMMAAGLRDSRRLLRVLGAIAASLTVTVTVLTLAGVALSVVHVMALQFVVGIGLDYALFFSRTGLDVEERCRTMLTLVTCNCMALLTFGLLCLCRTRLLRDIGETVAVGVVCAMVFGFLFAGTRVDEPRPA